MAEYVNNEKLRETVIKYNNLNVNDDGSWCASYAQRLENKYKAGKISKEKYDQAYAYIKNKVASIAALQAKYAAMTPDEKKKFDRELNKIRDEMSEYFLLIINGRVNSFKLRSTIRNYEDIEDIIQDAFICVLQYINRYDDARCSSCFAYVTQLATNSIILSLNKIKERDTKMVTGLDYYENLNTIDDFKGLSGMKRNLEE